MLLTFRKTPCLDNSPAFDNISIAQIVGVATDLPDSSSVSRVGELYIENRWPRDRIIASICYPTDVLAELYSDHSFRLSFDITADNFPQLF